MNWADYYKISLALCMWREARGEGHDGMRAVGHVIRNRVVADKIPDDWDQVIFRKWQFSSMTATGDSQLTAWPKHGDPEFDDALDISEHVYRGDDFDLTQGATHYFADTIPMPQWAKNMTETVKLGHHTFYKLP